jgi:hypothetical protein
LQYAEQTTTALVQDATFTGRTLEMLRNVRAELADALAELEALSIRSFGPEPTDNKERPENSPPPGRFAEVEAMIADITEQARAVAARARGLNGNV